MRGSSLLRLVGVLLLGFLLSRVDLGHLVSTIADASWYLVVAIFLNIPQLSLKVVRWKTLLLAQGICYGVWKAGLAYSGSIFLGLLTPGRLGELVKAFHVKQDCRVSIGRAFSSVLADRIFDLYMLLGVGGLALMLTAAGDHNAWLGIVAAVMGLTGLLVALLSDEAFTWISRLGSRLGRGGARLFGPESLVRDLRGGLKVLPVTSLVACIVLTIMAYTVFFWQCHLVALSIGIEVGFFPISFAVALGSLVTLLPLSISGIGTREAAIVAYLGSCGVEYERALGFAFLIFVTFYVAGGVIGALGWLAKPVSLDQARSIKLEK